VKAIRIHENGGPEAMTLDDLPTPVPGAGQVLIKVAAAGVNFFDTQLRSGLYKQPLPLALGNEGAGIVEAVGAGVSGTKPGDRVCWILASGSYATHALVDAERVVILPASLSFQQAAAAIFQGITAHHLAHSTYALKPGDRCVVHSAAGGVGALLCQMAKLRGAEVFATVSTDAKAEVAREAGADHVIVSPREDFVTEVKRLTDGKGVDVVYDAVGIDTFEKSLACLVPRGLLALYGEASGVIPPFDVRALLFAGSVYVTRTGLYHYLRDRAEYLERAEAVLGWVADGKLKLRIDATYPLAEAAAAHRALEGRTVIGKLLLLP
jgi:NADPH2:quinone reductase